MVEIKEFVNSYQTKAVEHILEIENKEFSMGLSLEMQPDLVDIEKMYQKQKGNFWIALDDERVIGTAGIYSLSDNSVELRRMFVKPSYRGKQKSVGQKLLDTSMEWAKEAGYSEILLETTEWLAAATRFYQKNNFKSVSITELPAGFPVLRPSGNFMIFTFR